MFEKVIAVGGIDLKDLTMASIIRFLSFIFDLAIFNKIYLNKFINIFSKFMYHKLLYELNKTKDIFTYFEYSNT